MTLPERDLGPIPVPVDDAGPNHVTTDNLQIPYRGTGTHGGAGRASARVRAGPLRHHLHGPLASSAALSIAGSAAGDELGTRTASIGDRPRR